MKTFTFEETVCFEKKGKNFDNVKPDDVVNKSSGILRKIKLVKEFASFVKNIKTLIEMVKAYCCKIYTVVPKNTIVSISFALIYVVTPVDAIPDNIPGIGYVDDIAVVERVLKSTNRDIEDYKEWEKQHHNVA